MRTRGTRQVPRDRHGRRILALLIVYSLLFALVVGQLVRVQVVHAEEYADRGTAQRARVVELPASRGRLYDREGEVLSTSVQSATIYADPRAYRATTTPDGRRKGPAGDSAEVAAELAPLLDLGPAEIERRLTQDSHFVYLARQLDWEVGEKIAALELPGVGLLDEPHRVYPGSSLAGQVLGFTGIDGEGLLGLESQHDTLLTGVPGQLAVERAQNGVAISSGAREVSPPRPGTDLVLTVDREIQHAAEQAAHGAVERHDAEGASVVVLEVATGEVLAMANAPFVDPNSLADSPRGTWRNRAVTDAFEPGSVQKALTAAAAIEEGVVTPTTEMTVDDRIEVGGKTFSDSHDHPTEEMTFADVIEQSSNVGAIMVGERLGAARLHDYLRAFGYGQPTGIGFPGESAGLLMPVQNWWATSLPTISIGQGVATSLVQVASAYATLANGGVATQPRLLRGTVGDDGRLTPLDPPAQRRVVGTRTADQVVEMLASVVDGDGGTGAAAAVPGYRAAGKTGTARKPRQDGRGYSGKYVASFVGLAPVEDPRLVVAVMVDQPTPIWGGVVAAPVFSEVMEFALEHRRIPPTESDGSLQQALDRAVGERALADARAEGPATGPDTPGSPPAGDPADALPSGAPSLPPMADE